MCASTRDLSGDGHDEQDRASGIVGNHSYCLLGAYELYEEDGTYRPLGDKECKTGE